MVRGARCVVRSGQQKTQYLPCQVFSCAALACQLLANEEKFTPAPEKNIFLTGEPLGFAACYQRDARKFF